jgi:hypothetical protein
MKKFLSGSGILIPILYPIGAFTGLVVAGVAGAIAMGSPDGTVAFALAGMGLGGALMTWVYASTLGKTRVYPVIDQALRRSVLVEKSHSFLCLSPRAWGVIATVVAVVSAGAGAVLWFGGGAGGALLHKSEKLLADAGGNVAYGNPEEGQSVAMAYGDGLARLRNPAAMDQLNIESPAGRQPARVFCHISTHGNAFIVHVPDLRSFSAEEKAKLKLMAWGAAQVVAMHEEPAPARIAVAVRDNFLYDEFLLGKFVPGYLGDGAGIEERYRPYATRVLYPFFEAPTLAVKLNVLPPPAPPVAATPVAPAPPSPAPAAMAATAPAPAPSAAAPAPSESVALGLPTPVCDWRSADGRVLRASLVRFTDATGTNAEFKREDGTVFTIPVDKFSLTDKAELQRMFNATKNAGGP